MRRPKLGVPLWVDADSKLSWGQASHGEVPDKVDALATKSEWARGKTERDRLHINAG
jgi:hypothetical protein